MHISMKQDPAGLFLCLWHSVFLVRAVWAAGFTVIEMSKSLWALGHQIYFKYYSTIRFDLRSDFVHHKQHPACPKKMLC